MRFCVVLYLSLTIVQAVFQDEAGKTDVYLPLVGTPRRTFFNEPSSDQGSLCYVDTKSGVLAALDCSLGTIKWRHKFASSDDYYLTQTSGGRIYGLEKSGMLSAWDAVTGRAQWSTLIGQDIPGASLTVNQVTGRIFVVSGSAVTGVDILDGAVIWITKLKVSLTPLRKIVSNEKTVFIVSLRPSAIEQEIVLSTLLAETGEETDLFRVGDMPLENGIDDIHVAEDDRLPALVYYNYPSRHLIYKELGSNTTLSVATGTFDNGVSILSKSIPDSTILVLQQRTGRERSQAFVYVVDATGRFMRDTWIVPASGAGSAMTLTQSRNCVYIVRVSQKSTTGVVEIWRHDSRERVSSYEVPHQPRSDSAIRYISAEVSYDPITYKATARVISTTDDHIISMWRGSDIGWHRDEGLAYLKKVLLIELHEPVVLQAAAQMGRDPLGNFASRIKRHLMELCARLTTLKFGTAYSAPEQSNKDSFGFKQYAVAIGIQNRVWAIDILDSAKVAWSIDIALPNTIAFDVLRHDTAGATNSSLPSVDVLLRDLNGQNYIVQLDIATGSQISLTKTSKSHSQYVSKAQRRTVELTMHGNSIEFFVFEGEALIGSNEFEAPHGERIVARSQIAHIEPIASVGRVLGDRGVLYKYLNEATVAIATVDDRQSSLTVWYLDALSGAIVYKAKHYDVSAVKAVNLQVSENWLVYHFWRDGNVKAYEMVILELYHGGRNARTIEHHKDVHNVSQSYIYDHEISAIATTTSKQGITSRDVVVALASGEISTISRRLLDPRRPLVEKLTPDDKEEMLIPYDNLISNDPKMVLSHRNHVIGVKSLVTGPTLLESTSLICAFGLDIFFTRVTPSMPYDILSDSFSKSQIGLSLVLLCAAIAFTRPIATRQNLNRRWIS